jgi:hypothetical protein
MCGMALVSGSISMWAKVWKCFSIHLKLNRNLFHKKEPDYLTSSMSTEVGMVITKKDGVAYTLSIEWKYYYSGSNIYCRVDAVNTNLRQLLLNPLKSKKIIQYERFKFFQSVQNYLATLQRHASTSDFRDLLEGLLLAQFINGLRDRKMLMQEKLTLEESSLQIPQWIWKMLLMRETVLPVVNLAIIVKTTASAVRSIRMVGRMEVCLQ